MPVFDIYSRRKRRPERGEPEFFQYDHVPHQLRSQVWHILEASLWSGDYPLIRNQLLREMGRMQLYTVGAEPKQDLLGAMIHGLPDVDEWLDVVDYCFHIIYSGREWWRPDGGRQNPDDAIEELNIRFRQAGLGYQFEAGQIVRVDSRYLHSE